MSNKILSNISSLSSFLEVVVISITNLCNMKCPQCAYSTRQSEKVEYMSVRLFSKIIDQCKKLGVRKVRLLGLSEPTLHPEFSDILKTAFAFPEIFLHVLTNGTLLENNVLSSLLNYPPHLLEVSIDAWQSETFLVVRGGNKALFERVIENTKHYGSCLKQGRKEQRWGQKYPQLCVSFVLHPESQSEAELFAKKWSFYVDQVRFRGPHNFSGLAQGLTSQRYSQQDSTLACKFLQSRIYVNTDGIVHACTLDFNDDFILGDLNNGSTLAKSWFNPARQQLLAAHLSKGVVSVPSPCVKCSKCSDLK